MSSKYWLVTKERLVSEGLVTEWLVAEVFLAEGTCYRELAFLQSGLSQKS